MPHPAHTPPLALFPPEAWEWGNWVQWPPGSKIIFSGESYCLVQKSSCLHAKGAGLCFHNNPGTACPSGMDGLPGTTELSFSTQLSSVEWESSSGKWLPLFKPIGKTLASLLGTGQGFWVTAWVGCGQGSRTQDIKWERRDPPRSASRKRNSHDHN